MIEKLVWRNLWRNRRRTLITTASITFAVLLAILMQSLQKGIFDNLVKNVVSFYHGYVQIHKAGYWNEQVLDNSFAANDTLLNQLKKNQHITEIVPRIETFVLVSVGNNTKGCMLVGTNPEKEDHLTHLKSKIIAGTYLQNNENAVLIAEGLAKRLHLALNDTLILLGQGYQGSTAAGKFSIKGMVHFGSPALNDALVYLPLSAAQSFLGAENMLTSIALAIDKPENMNLVQKQTTIVTGKNYEVMTWKQLMPEIDNFIKAKGNGSYIFTGILYFIIAFGIFGTILMMTAERRYEFGMLIAIGMKKNKLGRMLLGETFSIALLGVLLGIAISLPLVLFLKAYPVRLTGQTAKVYEQFGFEALFPAGIDINIFLIQSAIVLAIALVVGLYPLWHVSQIDPVKSMR